MTVQGGIGVTGERKRQSRMAGNASGVLEISWGGLNSSSGN